VRRAACLGALTVAALVACSSDEESACDLLSERLDSIEAEAAGLGEQSWESTLRGQELQAERVIVRRDFVEAGCAIDL
jgi:hypothetical protein